MKHIYLIIILTFLQITFLGGHSKAQTDSLKKKLPVDLNSYIQVVSKNNLEYAAEKYNIDISEAAIQMAKVIPDPSFSIDWLENREAKARTGFGFASELGTTIELGGKRKARIRYAEGERDLINAQLDDFFRNLRADAAIAFLEAEKQNRLYLMKKDSYITMKKLAVADSIRLTLGSIMEIDAVQSKLEAGILKNELIRAEADRHNALTELSLMAGLANSDTLFSPANELSGVIRNFDVNDLISIAVQNRSDIVAAKLNMELSAKNTQLVKKERFMDLDIKVGLENDYLSPNNVPPAKIISAGIGFPLKFSNLNKGELIAASYYEQQTSKQYEYIVQKITSEILQAYRYFMSTEKQVSNFKVNMLKQSENVLRGKIYSYNRGETSLLEVLNAQRTYYEIRSSYIETLTENYSALIELERAAGIWDIKF